MEIKEELKELIGKKIISIEEFDNSAHDNGFFIIFDNGKILTAQDGEFGDNAFNFVSEEEYKKSNKKNILLDRSSE